MLDELAEEAMAFVREGTDAEVTVERQVAMRYKGQGWEIPVRLDDAPFDEMAAELLDHRVHQGLRGVLRASDRRPGDRSGELVGSCRLGRRTTRRRRAHGDGHAGRRPIHPFRCSTPVAGVDAEAARSSRRDCARAPAIRSEGPAVIVESQTTTVLASHHAASMQGDGTMLVSTVDDGQGNGRP